MDFLGDGLDVAEIGTEDAGPVLAAEAEEEASGVVDGPGEAEAVEGVADWVSRYRHKGKLVALVGGGEDSGNGSAFDGGQRGDIGGGVAMERVLHPPVVEARDAETLVVMRALVDPPPAPAEPIQKRLEREQRSDEEDAGEEDGGDEEGIARDHRRRTVPTLFNCR